jgi:hypothetical protein
VLQALVALTLTAGWRLEWTAPPGCTQGPQVQARLEARLARQLFSPPSRLVIRGRVEAASPGWLAHLQLLDEKGNALGSRDVSSAEAACTALDARLDLVLALLVGPLSAQEPAIVTTTPAPAPSLAAPAAPPVLTATLDPTARVRASSDAPGTHLFEITTGLVGRGWYERVVDLCVCPCAVEVALPAHLYAGGDGIVRSEAVNLDPQLDGRSARLDVRAGSVGLRVGSVLSTSFGAAITSAALVALTLLLANRGEGWSLGLASGAAIVGGVGLTFGIVGLRLSQTQVEVSTD